MRALQGVRNSLEIFQSREKGAVNANLDKLDFLTAIAGSHPRQRILTIARSRAILARKRFARLLDNGAEDLEVDKARHEARIFVETRDAATHDPSIDTEKELRGVERRVRELNKGSNPIKVEVTNQPRTTSKRNPPAVKVLGRNN